MINKKYWIPLLIIIYIISRIIAAFLGVRYDTGHIWSRQHYPAESLLIYDLWRSLYYTHIQPPLYDTLYGISLKIAGDIMT